MGIYFTNITTHLKLKPTTNTFQNRERVHRIGNTKQIKKKHGSVMSVMQNVQMYI